MGRLKVLGVSFLAGSIPSSNIAARARKRQSELSKGSTAKSFLDEMRRFLPARRVAEVSESGLSRTILDASIELIDHAVSPATSE